MSVIPPSLSLIISRYYWLQVTFIAIAVITGVVMSALIMRGLLINEALKQEAEYFWHRYDMSADAPMPDTKNLSGYLWSDTTARPEFLDGVSLEQGVREILIDDIETLVMYDRHNDQHLLLIFAESNVNELIWFYGIAPLIISLLLLYSVLWLISQKTYNRVSPISQLTDRIRETDFNLETADEDPFDNVDTGANIEADELKTALSHYHRTLVDYIQRERQFTAEVSHELRTPLAVLKGSIQMLILKMGQSPALTRMRATTDDMEIVIETLLGMAREGSEWLTKEEVDLGDVAERIKNEFQYLAEGYNIQIDVQSHAQNTQLVNEALPYIVMSNLVRNAILYSRGSCVRIDIYDDHFVVEDDGRGMDETRYQNMKKTKEYKGLGIGIKLVRRLCESIHWQVEMKNRIGEGLKVIIRTPATR